MRSPLRLAVLSLALIGAANTPAFTDTIRYEFSGTLRYPVPADWPIHQGDSFQGTFFFDPDIVRVRFAIEGYKWYDPLLGSAGIEVNVSTANGVLTFANVPGYLAIELMNDYYAGYDQFVVYCSEAVRFPVFFRRLFVEFYLFIVSNQSSFLDSTDLPTHMSLPAQGDARIYLTGGANPQNRDYAFSLSIDHLALANRPPDCSAAVGRIPEVAALSGGWTPVTIEGVTDPEGDPVSIAVTGVFQDEPVVDLAARPTCPDATIDAGRAQVRLERSGAGNGRVYRVAFTASDGRGGTGEGAVTVCVPHDQSAAACVDDGTIHDSTQPCSGSPTLSAARVQNADLTVAATGPRDLAFDVTLPEAGELSLTIHDVAGRTIATLARAWYGPGTHRLAWRAGGLRRGLYFARLRTPGASVVKRVPIL
jgi:hypothetical protein